jgi:hypothetical protein
MPEERRLATFVQISDMHIGDLNQRNDAAALQWHYHRLFRGYLGHHSAALDHLDEFVAGLFLQETDARLFVTGDLTAFGRPSQFEFARAYITGQVSLGVGNYLGLSAPTAHSIPGNHDHWPGRPPSSPLDLVMFGEPTIGFSLTFPGLPLPIIEYPLTDAVRVTVAGIDSEADVDPYSPNRFFAIGSFKSQLSALRERFAEPNPNEIRILLLHHSPQHPDLVHGMERSSFWDLLRTIDECEISVLLTGHLHEPKGEMNESHHHNVRWEWIEARCGTTTVRDEIPESGSTNRSVLRPNTLLVHRLYEIATRKASRIEWRSSIFRRDPTRGFKNVGLLEFASLYGPRTFATVWPRG